MCERFHLRSRVRANGAGEADAGCTETREVLVWRYVAVVA